MASSPSHLPTPSPQPTTKESPAPTSIPSTSQSPSTVTNTLLIAPQTRTTALSVFLSDRTYRVNSEIRPGIYYSSNTATTYCDWTRLKDFTGGYSQNGFVIGKGQQIVEIKSTDVGFDSSGCGTWKQVATLPVIQRTSFTGEGTYSVTKQIKPGIYFSSNTATTYCDWTRLKDFTGGYSQNGFVIGKGQQIVEIKSTDVGFDSSGCGTWKQVATLPVNQRTSFTGEGTYSVTKQIKPGIYFSSNTATTYCDWTRLKDFTGGYSQNGFVIGKGQQIVEIKSTDVGFDSSGCGTWKPIAELPTSPQKTIRGEGVYSVPKQIVPGKYRSSNGASVYCSWTRLRDYSGGYSQNGFGIATGQRLIQIFSSDIGFESSGCGTWTWISR